MGSQGLNNPRLAAFQSDIFPRGLDLNRTVIDRDLGVYRADTSALFEAGMLVSLNTAQNVVVCAGTDVLGVAKWGKSLVQTAVAMDEPIAFTASNQTVNLKHQNVTDVQVRTASDFGGTAYTVTTDYTVSSANGTVTQVSGGAPIPLNTTVFVTYTYQLQASDFDFQGRNFWQSTDYVTIQDSRITVITAATFLFTSMYDTSRVYTLTGATANLYAAGGATPALAGLFTNNSAEGPLVGHVVQVPTATDPFLGVYFNRDRPVFT